MSFNLYPYQGNAKDFEAQVLYSGGTARAREAAVLEVLKKAADDLGKALGGYIFVSGYGHVNEIEGLPGDTITLYLGSLARPSAVPDAGATAALSSVAIDPPEAVTAAPQTADGSPPADQQPLTPPAPVLPPVAPVVDPVITPVVTPAVDPVIEAPVVEAPVVTAQAPVLVESDEEYQS